MLLTLPSRKVVVVVVAVFSMLLLVDFVAPFIFKKSANCRTYLGRRETDLMSSNNQSNQSEDPPIWATNIMNSLKGTQSLIFEEPLFM